MFPTFSKASSLLNLLFYFFFAKNFHIPQKSCIFAAVLAP